MRAFSTQPRTLGLHLAFSPVRWRKGSAFGTEGDGVDSVWMLSAPLQRIKGRAAAELLGGPAVNELEAYAAAQREE